MSVLGHRLRMAAGGAGVGVGEASFTFTSGTNYYGDVGYGSALGASEYQPSSIAFGTFVSGNVDVDGGTVEAVEKATGASFGTVYIRGGNGDATNINIDTTDYTLTFSFIASGYAQYTFSGTGSHFTVGVDFDIIIT